MPEPKAIVVVFTMPGCPACEQYMPTFQAVANRFPHVPRYVIDAASPQGAPYADHYGIQGTPTTMVLRKPAGALRAEGLLAESHVQELFSIAAAQR